MFLADQSFNKTVKVNLFLISLIAFLIQSCTEIVIQPKGLRTDLMRNPDYVGLNGKKQTFSINDDVLTKGKYEVAKVQSNHCLTGYWMTDLKNCSLSGLG